MDTDRQSCLLEVNMYRHSDMDLMNMDRELEINKIIFIQVIYYMEESFKSRFYNHMCDFRNEHRRNALIIKPIYLDHKTIISNTPSSGKKSHVVNHHATFA